MIIPIAPIKQPVLFSPAPSKNKTQLIVAPIMLSNSNLEKPCKLFLLGAGENEEIGVHCLLLLLCMRILLLLILLALLLLLYLVDFSQNF